MCEFSVKEEYKPEHAGATTCIEKKQEKSSTRCGIGKENLYKG